MVRCRSARERAGPVNIEIPQHIQDLMEEVWPDRTPRRRASELRKLIYDALRDEAKRLAHIQAVADGPLIPFETVPADMEFIDAEPPRQITDRIAQRAPRIDDVNWSTIIRGIEAAQARDRWGREQEDLLVERLNVDFDGAVNEFRVQKSRITAYFDRLL